MNKPHIYSFSLFIFLVPLCLYGQQQFDPTLITIARDSFGVPHIFAKTDAEVSYGLAWATAEDDFENAQIFSICHAGHAR